MATKFSSLALLAKRWWTKRTKPTLPEQPASVVTSKIVDKVVDKIHNQNVRKHHERFSAFSLNGVQIPDNIRRRILGSKMFKIDRDH